ncbi:MAG TPA: YHS domain-containing protein [Dehalococcoidia bacterium]|nr:YHS domain-containing protein [Dehalococcoidia bacterium]
MEYTTRVADDADEAHVNYQCPCGCTAGIMYRRESGSLHLGACCCGRLLWLGEDAESTIATKFEAGVAYDLDLATVTLPWGETTTAALAVPTARVKPDFAAPTQDEHHHDHEGHSHPHNEHGHEGHDHGHEHHDHEGHDHDHGTHSHAPAVTRVRDVVCGMEIEPAAAAGTSVYKRQTYYFCALSCKQKFDADPTQYVKSRGFLARLFGRS